MGNSTVNLHTCLEIICIHNRMKVPTLKMICLKIVFSYLFEFERKIVQELHQQKFSRLERVPCHATIAR